MTILRCLNEPGIREFERYLIRAKEDRSDSPPLSLLHDSRYSSEFDMGQVTVEKRSFSNRREFAEYIDSRFRDAGIQDDVDTDGVWEWLSLFYIDVTCPVVSDGARKIGEPHRYLMQPKTNRNPRRHLLRSAYMLHRRYGPTAPAAIAMLMGYPIDTYPLIWTHLNERPSAMASAAVLSAAHELFYDSAEGRPKGGLGHDLTGVRRFGKCIVNLPPEFDLTSLDSTTVLALLPAEFDDWIDDPARRAVILRTRQLLQAGGFQDFATSGARSADQVMSMSNALNELAVRDRTTQQVARKVRSDMFRVTLLSVYDSRCSVSGIGLVHEPTSGDMRYEVEAAHIVPVAKGGRDVVNNGLALNRTVHWAFDNGMIWIDSDFKVNLTDRAANNDRNRWLVDLRGARLRLPEESSLRPSVDHLRWHAQRVAEAEFR